MMAPMFRSGSISVRDEEQMKPMPVQHQDDETSTSHCLAQLSSNKKGGAVGFMVLAVIAVIVLAPDSRSGLSSQSDKTHSSQDSSLLPTYHCPATVAAPLNYDEAAYEESYINPLTAGNGNALIHENITKFLETFRTVEFDGWGRTYEGMKKGLYEWKSTMYPDNLNEGDSIYESACGIGLNLYMTLEIANEVKGLESLTVYGNEYMEENARNVDVLFQNGAPFLSRKGIFCTGDSADLDFVPSNSFDLVFTGYNPPLNNPLQFDEGDFNANYDLHRKLCTQTDWKSKKLAELAQARQNDFTAMVVGEMIRIAKPGKAVIVEQVAFPLCDEGHDWGGVTKDYWKESVDHYGWDIEPDSIIIEDAVLNHRYHVFMRKKSA